MANNKLTEFDIKYRTYYHLSELININDLDFKNIEIHKWSFKMFSCIALDIDSMLCEIFAFYFSEDKQVC